MHARRSVSTGGNVLFHLGCGRGVDFLVLASPAITTYNEPALPLHAKPLFELEELSAMSQPVQFELELPDDLPRFRLPEGVARRLQHLLDRQDAGETLSPDERREAEGLVNVAELLSLLRLRAERLAE